jgi:hypothetical protein
MDAERAVGIHGWFREVRRGFQERRAAEAHQRKVEQAGGDEIYRYEQEEEVERREAISIGHQQVKTAFRLLESTDAIPYDIADSPADFIAALIQVPKISERTFRYGGARAGDAAFREHSGTATKHYSLHPKINGTKFFDPDAVLDNRNPSPVVAFSYYLRTLTNDVYGSSSHVGTRDRHAKLIASMQYAPGLIAPTPQFAAVIRDGYGVRDIPEEFAGFKSVRQEEYLKEPVRVCILGELDGTGTAMSIRRLVIDGMSIKLSRENVALGIDYAANLVTQILEGKDYDPGRAKREALASGRANRARHAPEGRPGGR